MMRALAAFNDQDGLREKPLRIGIGLNVGDVVAGSIGSAKKLEFTVIGDTVNVASRIEGVTKRYGAVVVASKAVVDGAGGACVARRIDRAIVAGREEATELYEILDPRDPRAERIAIFERGVDHYFARRWAEAVDAFEEAAHGLDDPGATFQIERCRKLSASPPADDWTGVARLDK